MKDTSKYLEMAIKNIQDDREITRELLDDVVQYMSKDEQRHREVGTTAAKYVETLQRSNEQLVKVASLMQKRETTSAGLTELDKDELFDMISGGAPE
jgi:F0F1-type ATP synthase membrane subunit b/b'